MRMVKCQVVSVILKLVLLILSYTCKCMWTYRLETGYQNVKICSVFSNVRSRKNFQSLKFRPVTLHSTAL